MNWVAAADELVNIESTEQMAADLEAAGLRFIHDLFPGADHLTLATNDEYGPVAEFLGDHRVDRSPAPRHLRRRPDRRQRRRRRRGRPRLLAVGAAGARRRRPSSAARSTRGPRRSASATRRSRGVEQGAGAVQGGARGPMAYARRSQAWGEAPAHAQGRPLVVEAKNLASATVDTRRARLSCSPLLDVKSDGPLDLRLRCGRRRRPGSRRRGYGAPGSPRCGAAGVRAPADQVRIRRS